MKNITITVNDDLYRHARLCAAHRDATVTELVRTFLESLETVPGRRARAVRNLLLTDKSAIITHENHTHLTDENGVSGKMNTPLPPLSL